MTNASFRRPTEPGGVSPVAILLRSEAAVALGLGIAAYSYLGRSWWVFAALILAPDLSLLGYLRGARVGAWMYDLAHTYVGPVALALIGYGLGQPWLMAGAAVWACHVAIDRLVGYGLKFPADPKDTHLSRLASRWARGLRR